jgi:integrase
MAWITQLPSGLWMATVYTPLGRRTKTHDLKSMVKRWADEQERAVDRGDWIDPRQGETTIGDWWERSKNSRRRELASRRRDESHWRCHVGPYWAKVPLGGVLKPDVSTWVETMRQAEVGAATIEGALGVLRGLFEAAVDARMLGVNPARGVRGPRRSAHLDRVLAPEEDVRLLDALDRVAPGRTDGRLLGELMLYCGLRWEEAGALDKEHVDTRQRVIHVGPVLERDGTIRPYGKTKAARRTVPVDDDLWPRVRERAMAVGPGGLIVVGARGGTLNYSRWHDRVWTPALRGLPALPKVKGHAPRPAVPGAGLSDPQPTPHDLRHTYCTRLGEQGMVAHELMALSGHESLASVQRYLHAGDGRFERARKAVKSARSTTA